MDLSAHEKGYKSMAEYIDRLNIDSVIDQYNLKMYKGIKTALTFISSDMFGKLCAEKQYKISNEYNRKNTLIDNRGTAHIISQDATILLGGGGFPVAYGVFPSFNDDERYMDIHRIFTNGIADEEYWVSADRASDKAIMYEVSKLIFDTMAVVAAEVLQKVSHTKINAHANINLDFDLGEFASEEDANREFERFMHVFKESKMCVEDEYKNKMKESSELMCDTTYCFLTKDELIKEYEEDDIYNAHEEFEDNKRLGIINAAFPFLQDSPIPEELIDLPEVKINLHGSVDLNLKAFIKNADFKIHPSLDEDDAYLVHKFISTVIDAKNCMSSSLKYDNEKLCVIMKLITDMSYLKDNNVLDMVHVKIPSSTFECMKYLCKDKGYLYCSTIEFDHVTNTLTWVFPYKEEKVND